MYNILKKCESEFYIVNLMLLSEDSAVFEVIDLNTAADREQNEVDIDMSAIAMPSAPLLMEKNV